MSVKCKTCGHQKYFKFGDNGWPDWKVMVENRVHNSLCCDWKKVFAVRDWLLGKRSKP